MRNPKHLDDVDIVDMIWFRSPEAYARLVDVNHTRIVKPRKELIRVYNEVYERR